MDAVELAKKVFDAATKVVEIIETSGLSDGPQKAAVIRVVAITYGMEAKELNE